MFASNSYKILSILYQFEPILPFASYSYTISIIKSVKIIKAMVFYATLYYYLGIKKHKSTFSIKKSQGLWICGLCFYSLFLFVIKSWLLLQFISVICLFVSRCSCHSSCPDSVQLHLRSHSFPHVPCSGRQLHSLTCVQSSQLQPFTDQYSTIFRLPGFLIVFVRSSLLLLVSLHSPFMFKIIVSVSFSYFLGFCFSQFSFMVFRLGSAFCYLI